MSKRRSCEQSISGGDSSGGGGGERYVGGLGGSLPHGHWWQMTLLCDHGPPCSMNMSVTPPSQAIVSWLGSILPMITVSRERDEKVAPLSTPLTTPSGVISVALATMRPVKRCGPAA